MMDIVRMVLLLRVMVHLGMAKPKECPDDVFAIISRCWEYEPDKRITFSEIFEFFTAKENKSSPTPHRVVSAQYGQYN